MHVLQINVPLDPLRRSPDELLRGWYLLADVASSVASVGVRVSVAQANHEAACRVRDGATFHFVPPDESGASVFAGRAFRALVERLQPDVFHVHGLGFPHECTLLHSLAPEVPVLLQDHADRVPRLWWRRRSMRRGLARVAGVVFCAREQATPFFERGVLHPRVRVYEYPGTSALFTPGDQSKARAASGLFGDPCLLWVGHLNRNKDPLTVLRGLRKCLHRLPGAHLWCCFGDAPLLAEVNREIARAPSLSERVHMIGRVPHENIETLMQAADIFILGSHKEGSGVALIESLATGLSPVVSAIPSFRAITGGGEVGKQWKCGSSDSFAEALVEVAARTRDTSRAATRAYFERELSYAAGGRKLRDAYADMLIARGKPARVAVPA